MSKGTLPYYCGVCKKSRDRDVNHWLVLFVAPSPEVAGAVVFVVYRWGQAIADVEGAEFACGYDHASILFARWMSTDSIKEKRELAQ